MFTVAGQATNLIKPYVILDSDERYIILYNTASWVLLNEETQLFAESTASKEHQFEPLTLSTSAEQCKKLAQTNWIF